MSGPALAAAVALLSASLAPQPEPRTHSGPLDLLTAWVEAGEDHVPGRIDPALLEAARWSEGDLGALRVYVSVMFTLADDPSLRRIRFVPSEHLRRSLASDPRARPVLDFQGATLDAMRPLANRIRAMGPDVAAKRGTLLHTDVVTLGLDESVLSAPASVPRAPQRVFMDDGQMDGVADLPLHWELGRFAASRVGSSDSARTWSRDWYRATVAFVLRERQYGTEQVKEALRLFPSDAPVALSAAVEHELFASPEVQAFVDSLPVGWQLQVQSLDRELAEAERFLQRALELDASSVEARVRLGRVLGLRGRHTEAVAHLDRAARAATEAAMAYYANLLLGLELTLTGESAGARQAYQNAAALFPRARSPHLALAQLDFRSGDVPRMNERLQRSLAGEDDAADDPWFGYFVAAGRNAESMLHELRESVRTLRQ